MSAIIIKGSGIQKSQLEKLLPRCNKIIVKVHQVMIKDFCDQHNIEYIKDTSMMIGKNLLDSYLQLINLYSPNYIVISGNSVINDQLSQLFSDRIIRI